MSYMHDKFVGIVLFIECGYFSLSPRFYFDFQFKLFPPPQTIVIKYSNDIDLSIVITYCRACLRRLIHCYLVTTQSTVLPVPTRHRRHACIKMRTALPANTKTRPSVVSMLVQRRWRWANVGPALLAVGQY